MAVVDTVNGKLRGNLVRNENGAPYYEFVNIPYAKPPIGNLRFKSPQPVEKWEGEKDVTSIDVTKVSLQRDMTNGQVIGSEDCLYLNVYTPTLLKSDSKEKLPVMVYIHGGGFVMGSGIITDENGPQYLLEHNVVIVAINYRLGVFGFLNLGIPEAAGNMGLKDQSFALRWVRDNIENFGGEKNNITVFGISAGSASVEYQILSPLSKKLFHKAILQSGSTINHWAFDSEPQKLINQLLQELKYVGNYNDTKAIYDYLFTIDAKILVENSFIANLHSVENRITFGFVPSVEQDFGNGDAFLTIPPYLALKEGKFSKIPLIRGYCNGEGHLTKFLNPQIFENLNNKQLLNFWPYHLSATDTEKYNAKLFDVYYKNVSKEKAGLDFFGDFDFIAGIQVSAKLTANQKVPQRLYELSYYGKLNLVSLLFGKTTGGAAHGDDLGYLFDNKAFAGLEIPRSDILVRKMLTRMWTDFAKTSNPTPSTDDIVHIRWPEYTNDSRIYLNIDEDLKVVLGGYKPKKIAVFEEIYDISN